MESAILEQLQKLPVSGQQKVLRYLEALVIEYAEAEQNESPHPIKK